MRAHPHYAIENPNTVLKITNEFFENNDYFLFWSLAYENVLEQNLLKLL